MSTVTTRGMVHVLSAPTALCPHVEWALRSVLGGQVTPIDPMSDVVPVSGGCRPWPFCTMPDWRTAPT